MPTPVAHCLAGACLVALARKRLPAAGALPVAAAALFAANAPDLDYLAVLGGREAMERCHQGFTHSIVFSAAAALAVAWPLRRRVALAHAWLLTAAAALSHLLLDSVAYDPRPPIGFPLFWPVSPSVFHAPWDIFPGIDRVTVFGARNLHELLVELALGIPALLLVLWASSRSFGAGPGGSRDLAAAPER